MGPTISSTNSSLHNNYIKEEVFVKIKVDKDKIGSVNKSVPTFLAKSVKSAAADRVNKSYKELKPKSDNLYPAILVRDQTTNIIQEAILPKEASELFSAEDLKNAEFYDKRSGVKERLNTQGLVIGHLSHEQESMIMTAFNRYLEEYRAAKLQLIEERAKPHEDKKGDHSGQDVADTRKPPETVRDHIKGRLEKKAKVLEEAGNRQDVNPHADRQHEIAGSQEKGMKTHERKQLEKENEIRHQKIDKNIAKSDQQRTEDTESSIKTSEGLSPKPKKQRIN